MDDRIDLNKLRERQQTSLIDHYLGLHVTVVSVALATAGVSAASLIARPENMGTGLVELWLLWFGSFLATAVAYAGTMVGAFALPPSVPKIVDLLLPLIMGIVEFLLFTILIRQITALTQLDTIINAWLILMALFGAVAGLSVLQARQHFIVGLLAGTYLGDARKIIEGYVRHLVSDVLGTGLLTIVAALAFSLRIAGLHVSG